MRILVPLDSSTYCQAAQHVAFQLAASLPHAALHGIHIVNVRTASGNIISDLPGYAGFEPAIVSDEVYQAHRQAAKAMVDTFVNRAIAEGLTATGEVIDGAVTPSILKAADHANLVVMGMRGESEDRFPGQGGAQAANALPQLSVPCILVPREVTRITGLAVGYDGSTAAAHALRSASLLVDAGLPYHLIHVGQVPESDPLEEAVRNLPDEVVTEGRVYKHYVDGDSVHAALMEATASSNANLLCLGFRGDDPLKNALFGSSREYLLGHESVALLIAR